MNVLSAKCGTRPFCAEQKVLEKELVGCQLSQAHATTPAYRTPTRCTPATAAGKLTNEYTNEQTNQPTNQQTNTMDRILGGDNNIYRVAQ